MTRTALITFSVTLILAMTAAAPARTRASESVAVAVVIGSDAPELERFAAAELCGYLDKLFGVTVTPVTAIPASADHVFLIGSPATNPLINPEEFPDATDQGIVLKRVQRGESGSVLIVGGGSPRATSWAVYELVERCWGVRYLLHGDVLPAPKSFAMPTLDLKQEPVLRVRQWRVINEHAMGPVAWGIADYRPLLNQLAKLKFNRVLLYIWPGQPFLPLEHKGIRQTSGTLFFGNRYPITDDMIGRSVFGGDEREFWNPDLPTAGSPDDLTKAGVAHVHALMSHAAARGMQCVMPANLTEFPREFKPLLAHLDPVDMVGTPTIGPGAKADIDDPVLARLARAVLETTVKTYPGLDYIALDLPEWREWSDEYQRAWTALDSKYDLARIRSLADILAAAERRANYPGGPQRAVREVKADIVALYFYDRFVTDPQLGSRKIVLSTVAEELYPLLARILPAGSETLNFVDYTPSRIVKRRAVLADVPARKIPSVLIYTLHDDNVGVLPQLATGSLHELTRDITGQGWAGFSTRYWLIGDHDPCVAYLARAAWDGNATPDEVYRDQIARVCGEAAVADMLNVFREVEAATVALEWHGLGLTFTTPRMMMQHWTPGEMSGELKAVPAHYRAALESARRAAGKTEPSGRRYIDYWIGRLQFGIDYMDAIAAVRAAATAKSARDNAAALREATRALDLVERALNEYTKVAGDRSDRGAIAVMNEHVYRPLRAKVAELKAARH